MGYTHYWRHTEPFNDESWAKLNKVFTALLKHMPASSDTAGGYHSDDPLAIMRFPDDKSINFNGAPELSYFQAGSLIEEETGDETLFYANGLESPFTEKSEQYQKLLERREKGAGEDYSHENVYITKELSESFSFCKTARKPYDLIVVATIVAAHLVNPDGFSLSTDGDEEDLQPGIQYLMEVNEKEKLGLDFSSMMVKSVDNDFNAAAQSAFIDLDIENPKYYAIGYDDGIKKLNSPE